MASYAAGSTEAHLIDLCKQLIESVSELDWDTYKRLCSEDLSCFEPEAVGHLVEGLPFHQYYFELLGEWSAAGKWAAPTTTLVSPKVRMLGPDAAVVTFIRLQQKLKEGAPVTAAGEETRVWQKVGGAWKHVHFHRSACP